MAEEKKCQYLIEFENGKRRKVTVPASWKVTFGPAVVGADKVRTGTRYKMPMAIRFYESKDQQKAIFTDVISFRDLSIPIEEERITKQDKIGQMEIDGSRKNVNISTKVREWVNPDDLDSLNEPSKLIKDSSDEDIIDLELEGD